MSQKIIRAKAPLRIGIAGGGTDVDPYASEKGGLVFNTTIDKYAYCTLIPNNTTTMTVISPDYGTFTQELTGEFLDYDGNSDLVKAAVNHFGVRQGFKAFIRSDVPPGSGLGGSSTLMVAIIKAFAEWQKIKMSKADLALLAYRLEREEIGLSGGKQDQYAAAYGGFNMMYFSKKGVEVKPLKVKDSLIKELEERSILCFTGKSRDSADIIDSQVKEMKSHNEKSDEAYDETKRLAGSIGRSMQLGDIDGAAAQLNLAWIQKKKFSSKVANPLIDDLYKTAMRNGAVGGKVSGAGGGGFMYFICAPGKKEKLVKKLTEKGAEIMEFSFDPKGARTGGLDVGHYTSRIVSGVVGSIKAGPSDGN